VGERDRKKQEEEEEEEVQDSRPRKRPNKHIANSYLPPRPLVEDKPRSLHAWLATVEVSLDAVETLSSLPFPSVVGLPYRDEACRRFRSELGDAWPRVCAHELKRLLRKHAEFGVE